MYQIQDLCGKDLKAWDTFLELLQSVETPFLGEVRQCSSAILSLLQGTELSYWARGKAFTKELLLPGRL